MTDTYLSVKVHPSAGKDLLARGLQVSRDRLRITKGRSGRLKVFRIIR